MHVHRACPLGTHPLIVTRNHLIRRTPAQHVITAFSIGAGKTTSRSNSATPRATPLYYSAKSTPLLQMCHQQCRDSPGESVSDRSPSLSVQLPLQSYKKISGDSLFRSLVVRLFRRVTIMSGLTCYMRVHPHATDWGTPSQRRIRVHLFASIHAHIKLSLPPQHQMLARWLHAWSVVYILLIINILNSQFSDIIHVQFFYCLVCG